MPVFRRVVFAMVARDAAFVALAVATLMIGFSFAPALSLAMGAHAALAFCMIMVLRAACLREDRIERTELWRSLSPHERPTDEAERRQAHENFQDVLLRFAKAAAAIAVALYGASLIVSPDPSSRSLHAVVSQFQG